MKLNWRNKGGLLLTLVAVGCGLFLECSTKQAVGLSQPTLFDQPESAPDDLTNRAVCALTVKE